MLSRGPFAERCRAQRVVLGRFHALRAVAAFGLAVLVAGFALPLMGLVLADEPVSFCCSKGRCCCADVARSTDEAPCLRRGCGCGHSDELVTGAPLRIEAVLSASARVGAVSPAQVRWASMGERPIARADDPPVPPPRRPLPA
jgi:hypothetical protein